jgi:ABC-type nickel/cobalt efflux system permease component RcnA
MPLLCSSNFIAEQGVVLLRWSPRPRARRAQPDGNPSAGVSERVEVKRRPGVVLHPASMGYFTNSSSDMSTWLLLEDARKACTPRIMGLDHHHHACDCAAHRHAAKGSGDARTGTWETILPILACAVCPACMATYAKVLSLVGVSVGLSELHHTVVLAVAIAVSTLVSAWRSLRTRRVWPVAFAVLGSSLVIAGHVRGELHALEWTGVLVLLGSGLAEHFRLRKLAAARRASA